MLSKFAIHLRFKLKEQSPKYSTTGFCLKKRLLRHNILYEINTIYSWIIFKINKLEFRIKYLIYYTNINYIVYDILHLSVL